MVTKIGTFTTKESIDKGAKTVAAGAVGNRTLMQTVTIAALSHLAEHGNVNILAELYKASFAFKSKALADKWLAYVQEYSWIVWNPNNLKGKALKDAAFDTLARKADGKVMNVEGAKLARWDDFESDPVEAKAKNMESEVAAIAKRLTKMLAAGKLLALDGTPCTIGALRTALRAAIETIEAPHVTIETPKVEAIAPKVDDNTVTVTAAKATRAKAKANVQAAKQAA